MPGLIAFYELWSGLLYS